MSEAGVGVPTPERLPSVDNIALANMNLNNSPQEGVLNAIGTTGDEYSDKIIHRLNPEKKLGEIEDYYNLEEKLGEGAFAEVFKGKNKISGKEVAIKIVSLEDGPDEPSVGPVLIGSSEALAKRKELERTRKLRRKIRILENEVTIMRRIAKMPAKKRKSLVTIDDVLANSRRVCFSMELLSGGELFDRVLMKQNYTELDAAHLMRRIMKGIRALHRAGIIHRDLKPENLVFETQMDDSRIKITDFGLATVVGHPDLFRKIVVGSPGYIAPEVINEKLYTPACDIWSMGCILFILLVGGPPFGGSTNQELFDNIKAGNYLYPSDSTVSDEAKDLISKMLCLDHNERINAQGVLTHPWLMRQAYVADLRNTMTKLRAFNTRRKLKAVATAMVWGGSSTYAKRLKELLSGTLKADGFTGDELSRLRERLFEKADKYTIDQDTFIEVFESMDWEDLPLIDMFDVFKKDGTTEADVREICIGMSTAGKTWNGTAALRYCFETYDRDGAGAIPKEDVMKILKAVMGDEKFAKIASGFKSIFDGMFFKSKKVSYSDFQDKFIKYGDWGLKGKIVQPVQQLIKRATMLGRNRLSSTLSLATIRSSTSMRVDQIDDPTLAFLQDAINNDQGDDSDSDDSDVERTFNPGRKASRLTKLAHSFTMKRKRKGSKSGKDMIDEVDVRKSQSFSGEARKSSRSESITMRKAKEALKTFARKSPKPPSEPKPRRVTDLTERSGWSMDTFNVEDEV